MIAQEGTETGIDILTWRIVPADASVDYYNCNELPNGDFELGRTDWYLNADIRVISELLQTIPPTQEFYQFTLSGIVPDSAASMRLWLYSSAGRQLTVDDLLLRYDDCGT